MEAIAPKRGATIVASAGSDDFDAGYEVIGGNAIAAPTIVLPRYAERRIMRSGLLEGGDRCTATANCSG